MVVRLKVGSGQRAGKKESCEEKRGLALGLGVSGVYLFNEDVTIADAALHEIPTDLDAGFGDGTLFIDAGDAGFDG